MHVHPAAVTSAEVREFTRVFRLKPGLTKYEIKSEALTPFPDTFPPGGVEDARSRDPLAVAGAVLRRPGRRGPACAPCRGDRSCHRGRAPARLRLAAGAGRTPEGEMGNWRRAAAGGVRGDPIQGPLVLRRRRPITTASRRSRSCWAYRAWSSPARSPRRWPGAHAPRRRAGDQGEAADRGSCGKVSRRRLPAGSQGDLCRALAARFVAGRARRSCICRFRQGRRRSGAGDRHVAALWGPTARDVPPRPEAGPRPPWSSDARALFGGDRHPGEQRRASSRRSTVRRRSTRGSPPPTSGGPRVCEASTRSAAVRFLVPPRERASPEMKRRGAGRIINLAPPAPPAQGRFR